MATNQDIKLANEKIAGHRVPTWNGVDPSDLLDIVNDNMNKPQKRIIEQPVIPGLCMKCRNPIAKCICNG